MGTAAVLVVLLFVLSVLLWLDDYAYAYIHVQLSMFCTGRRIRFVDLE